jgi:hexosaminidase
VNGLCPAPRWDSRVDDGAPPELPGVDEAYRIDVTSAGVEVHARTEVGRYRAATTVAELDRSGALGADRTIVDWPELRWRGVTLDVSRGRVPTVEDLELTIERLAGLKVNHVELYLEASFAHPDHAEVCEPHGAYRAEEVRHLVDFARARHVELVGQQASLGHLEHFLAHPDHAGLAALPGGYVTPDGSGHEPPACLEPRDDRAFTLAAGLVTAVAEAFDQPRVHLGLDEPIDLNPAIWDAIFDVPGAPVPWAGVDDGTFCIPLPPDRVRDYAEWVRRLRALPALAGREVLMWADVVAAQPELLDLLPDGVTLVEWGYESTHPFDARVGRIRAAGRPCWVAAGTSGWSSISGRVTNMQDNVRAAVRAARRHGAKGLLVTSWEVLPSVSDWPGFVWGAASAWNPDREVDLADALDRAVAGGSGLGRAWVRLGRVHDLVVPGTPETGAVSEMFRSGGMAAVGLVLRGMGPEVLDAVVAELDRAAVDLTGATTEAPDGEVLRSELWWVRDALRWGVAAARHVLGWPDPLGDHDWLASEHDRLLAEHGRLWRCRNRQEGYDRVAAALAAIRGGI